MAIGESGSGGWRMEDGSGGRTVEFAERCVPIYELILLVRGVEGGLRGFVQGQGPRFPFGGVVSAYSSCHQPSSFQTIHENSFNCSTVFVLDTAVYGSSLESLLEARVR